MTTGTDAAAKAGALLPSAGRPSIGKAALLALTLIITLVLASGWLVMPYFFEGKTMLTDISDQVAKDRTTQQYTLGQVMTRAHNAVSGDGVGYDVDALYASPTYFERTTGPKVRARYELDKNIVFFLNETTHIDLLNQELPRVELVVDGVAYEPTYMDGPIFTDHHRPTDVRFAAQDATGRDIITAATKALTLRVWNKYDVEDAPRILTWELPIFYPAAENVLTSPTLIAALSAGLLSATLTPCLLQLLVVYMATLTGLSAEQMSRGDSVPMVTRRRMVLIALIFVAGFTAFYTFAGAVIGYAGRSAQIIFDSASREMAVGTGILVIVMGIWMGIKSRAPLVCRMPMPKRVSGGDRSGYVRSFLLSVGFSLGCMVCFSGAIVATLLVYVGMLGSASVGAAILFVFSMGVAIPFLLAAFFLSRTMSAMQWISRYTPQIGFVSMIVIVAFGLVLVTDNFHRVSDIIYPWLGLN
ncbi:MAG: cytochrome c biogenesis protein CcdA [Phaeovulum sp.]|uniref:cytochrome c biogenesis CcdA family protein n=1 Tax=Phaeovulum sp. TaxID=2934796 RepID=UPI0027330F35|nr:cytochrome c biogenesis protein CcdA [Phaeovulum sp.]MDP3861647.1 cytochrome c biogenesis protein CcdA [Phaeovulum sp.]